jgi:hypothetical protein
MKYGLKTVKNAPAMKAMIMTVWADAYPAVSKQVEA